MIRKIHRNSLQPGHKIQWYEIRDILGQGGFGITYLAYDTNLDKEFAIKEYLPMDIAVREGDQSVHPATEDNNDVYNVGLNNFISEARTLSKFEHPNIVRVYSVFEDNNTAYMVMAMERGKTLQELLKDKKTLEESIILKILYPLVGAINYLHEKEYIHRDIKPDNILIRHTGDPVLIDFGAARQAIANKALTSIVSPGYAPIEQYQKSGDQQGSWTDIYALGATLYRAVCGIPPIDAIDRSHAIASGKKDPFVPAMEVASIDNYSERLLKAIDRAMSFNTADRPKDIIAWFNDIKPSDMEELKKPFSLNKYHYLSISMLAIIALLSFVLYKNYLTQKEREMMPETVYLMNNELAGLWDSTYGVLDFEKVGENSFHGKYTYGEGKLYGKLIDNTLSGYYTENEEAQRCSTEKYDSYYWGTFKFEFNNDFSGFKGLWAECELPLESKWNGERMR